MSNTYQSNAAAARQGARVDAIDHLELYVGNAFQAAQFFRDVLGFKPTAYRGPESGQLDRTSFLVEQGDIRLVLTAPLSADSSVAAHVHTHGDGVKDIAFAVPDATRAFVDALDGGADPVQEPTEERDEFGYARRASIVAYGDVVHSFVERSGYKGLFMPGFRSLEPTGPVRSMGLTVVDHIASCVPAGELDALGEYYAGALGFARTYAEETITTYSAMRSEVREDETGVVKFTLLEPAPGERPSQIAEYLSSHRGAGVQHIAFATNDIVATVRQIRQTGLKFRQTPRAYYQELTRRVGGIEENIAALEELSILVDRDRSGYLLQIFTRPLQDRPTLFVEIIQRKGATGFGSGNIKALFESIEREEQVQHATR